MTNNISHDSPCFVGFVPDKAVPSADVEILVDVAVPWFPSDVQTNEKSFSGGTGFHARHRDTSCLRF